MPVERSPIHPAFLYMDEAGIENVLGVGIFHASSLCPASQDHGCYDRPRRFQHTRWQPYGADNQEHWISFISAETACGVAYACGD
jgi:hypothetical protein